MGGKSTATSLQKVQVIVQRSHSSVLFFECSDSDNDVGFNLRCDFSVGTFYAFQKNNFVWHTDCITQSQERE